MKLVSLVAMYLRFGYFLEASNLQFRIFGAVRLLGSQILSRDCAL